MVVVVLLLLLLDIVFLAFLNRRRRSGGGAICSRCAAAAATPTPTTTCCRRRRRCCCSFSCQPPSIQDCLHFGMFGTNTFSRFALHCPAHHFYFLFFGTAFNEMSHVIKLWWFFPWTKVNDRQRFIDLKRCFNCFGPLSTDLIPPHVQRHQPSIAFQGRGNVTDTYNKIPHKQPPVSVFVQVWYITVALGGGGDSPSLVNKLSDISNAVMPRSCTCTSAYTISKTKIPVSVLKKVFCIFWVWTHRRRF